MKKSITLEKTGYVVKGTALLSLWGGGSGTIEMKPIYCNTLTKLETLLNDNGFGCESIDGAIVDIYENFQGYEIYKETRTINIVPLSERQRETLRENYYNIN
jgi:hypothetical protein